MLVPALAALPDRALRAMLGRPVLADGQELHVEAQLGLKLLEISGSPPLESLSVADARAQVIHDGHVRQRWGQPRRRRGSAGASRAKRSRQR